jgi:hypothetical protein
MLFSLIHFCAGQDIRVTSIKDTHDGAVEELSAGSSQGSIVTRVVVNLALGKHGHVFDLRLAQMRAVGGDNDQLRLLLAKRFDRCLVSQDSLSGLHDHLQATVHRVLLLLLRSSRKKYENK